MGFIGDTLGSAWDWVANNPDKVARAVETGVELYKVKRALDHGLPAGSAPRGPLVGSGPLFPGQNYAFTGAGSSGGWEDPMQLPQLPQTQLGPYGGQGELPGGNGMAIGSALQTRSPIPGGIALGRGQGLFHTTPAGFRLPNRITLVKDDDSNKLAFFVDAGVPDRWSKISYKKSRHHHHPR